MFHALLSDRGMQAKSGQHQMKTGSVEVAMARPPPCCLSTLSRPKLHWRQHVKRA